MSTSRIEISRSAFLNNLAFTRELIGEQCELVAVIKGNAYGHGTEVFSSMLFSCGVRSFAVFSADEARKVGKINFDRLIIMGSIPHDELDWAISNSVEMYVFNWDRLHAIVKTAKKLNTKAKIHVELETGMNRTGFIRGQLEKLALYLKQHENVLTISGVCTHLAGAEDISNYVRIKKQLGRFKRMLVLFDKRELDYEKVHIACSAAIINYPKTKMDMVRVGILLYGFWPSRESRMAYLIRSKAQTDPLKRVVSWKSSIMDLKQVKEGEYVGYGTSFLAELPMTVAIIPVGYSHGFTRALSNQGKVLIGETRVGVIGMVNMNMIAVDVTNVEDVSLNDEVVLIGQQGTHEISLAPFGEVSNQLNYELLTRLPLDIPRVIIG